MKYDLKFEDCLGISLPLALGPVISHLGVN